MHDAAHVVGVILGMGAVTALLRLLPFVAARWLGRHPAVQRLGGFLPPAIMMLLVLHSVLGSAGQHAGGPWPELAAIGLTVGLQAWRGQALASIAAGTVLYVFLRQGVGP